MERAEAAQAYLNQNKLLYLNMLEVLRRGTAELLYAGEDGVLLYDRGVEGWMLSARDRGALDRFMPYLEGSHVVVGHEMWYRDELARRLGLWKETPCFQAAWMQEDPPDLPDFSGELRLLGPEYLSLVQTHYSKADLAGEPQIRAAIGRGMLGAFVDGALAGFVGIHEEGSIGLLEVLPAFRRRGLGEVLLLGAVRLALSRGQYAFGQVLIDNEPSLALQKKAGMTLSQDVLYWLFQAGQP